MKYVTLGLAYPVLNRSLTTNTGGAAMTTHTFITRYAFALTVALCGAAAWGG